MKRTATRVLWAEQLLEVAAPRNIDWVKVPLSRLVPKRMTAYHLAGDDGECHSTLYDVHRPPRLRHESPVMYYRRWKMVDNRFTHGWRGWYYCNPAHCKRRWRNKAERDKHLDEAYAIL